MGGMTDERIDLSVCLPLVAMHAACAAVWVTGASATALAVCLALVFLRAFGLTAGYHRLLSHHSFRCGRGTRFALAWLGASAAQLGPLWWAGHHRLHHRHSDHTGDPHSPHAEAGRGLAWAHAGWLLCRKHARTPLEVVPDLARAPELVWLERFHWLPPLVLAAALTVAGGAQLLVWGFVVSTVLLYHLTFAVNSLGHRFGRQRFPGRDQSRNLPWLAWLTLGDGWHNNHHARPAWARHGVAAGELDLTWLALRGLERLGLAWDLRGPRAPARPPPRSRARRRPRSARTA
jgi:stearoyl-CoA desaturase (delta-9 desaturase)